MELIWYGERHQCDWCLKHIYQTCQFHLLTGNCWIWPKPQTDWIWLAGMRNWKSLWVDLMSDSCQAMNFPPPWAFHFFQSFTMKWRSLWRNLIQLVFFHSNIRIKDTLASCWKDTGQLSLAGWDIFAEVFKVLPSKPLQTTKRLIDNGFVASIPGRSAESSSHN